jgi:hypothetical protein
VSRRNTSKAAFVILLIVGFDVRLEQKKYCAVRIADDGKSADICDVLGRLHDCATLGPYAPNIRVYIIGFNTAKPAGPGFIGPRPFRDHHQICNHRAGDPVGSVARHQMFLG